MASLPVIEADGRGVVTRGCNKNGKKGKIRWKSGKSSGKTIKFNRASLRQQVAKSRIDPNKTLPAKHELKRGDRVLVKMPKNGKHALYCAPIKA